MYLKCLGLVLIVYFYNGGGKWYYKLGLNDYKYWFYLKKVIYFV